MNIGIDIDEVLANHIEKVNEFYFKKFGKMYFEKDYFTYNWWDVWGCSKEDAIKINYEFMDSDLFNQIVPLDGAVDAVQKLSEYRIFVITSRPIEAKQKTIDWITNNFNRSDISIIHSGDFFGGKTKAQLCVENDIGVFIEDNKKYAEEIANKQVRVILLNKPWNSGLEHDNVIRVQNWQEVIENIEKMKGEVFEDDCK